MIARALVLPMVACLALAVPSTAAPLATKLFGRVQVASQQPPEPIGGYSRGCGAGMVELPESGPTWQAMRLSRNRNWGQPDLIDYIEGLSQQATRLGWPGLFIGDLAQPRGGPSASGHLSHQTGLDVDIWYLSPKRLDLSPAQREKISANSVRTSDQLRVNENWTEAHHQLLKMAASDPRVDRIFVAAAIKIEMCKTATAADKTWLQRIRPIYGHDDHFHVRLKCPKGARQCQTQKPTVAELSNGGNGCDETLTWWVTTYLEELKHPKPGGKKSRGPRDYTMADLPKACVGVLESP